MEQDDAFHLTAVDVRRYEFATVMRGYDRARVDQFKQQVADEIERLMRSNLELEDKARNFHEQLRAFRERDRALNEALISAQELRNEVKSQAKREAEIFLQEAEQQGARLRAAAQEEIASLLQEIEQLDRTRRAYLAQLKMFAERHLAEVAASEAERPFINASAAVERRLAANAAAAAANASISAAARAQAPAPAQPTVQNAPPLPPLGAPLWAQRPEPTDTQEPVVIAEPPSDLDDGRYR
jgi:DivIVA domain-containing protein